MDSVACSISWRMVSIRITLFFNASSETQISRASKCIIPQFSIFLITMRNLIPPINTEGGTERLGI